MREDHPFRTFWQAYETTAPRDMMITTVVVAGEKVMLNHALSRLFNDTQDLPGDLRKAVIAELERWRPATHMMGGRKEADPRYWRERIYRVSQAARALRPLLERKMVNPSGYPAPLG